MRALSLVRLYALAVLALVVLGGMVLRPGSAPSASQVTTAGIAP